MSEEQFVQEEEFDGAAPSQEEAAAAARDTRVWRLDDGTEVSMSEFIRERFVKDNMSRKEIAEKFNINYRTVYGATVNMVNDAEPAGRGRAAANHKINVTENGDVVTVIEGVTHVNNVAVSDEEAAELETIEVDRNEWIRQQVESGVSRGEVAKKLGLSYGVVYNVTKDIKGASQRHMIEYQGETMSRSEYIRRRFQEGVSKSEIAKELGVDYPVVWSALKTLKSETEKYQDALKRLEKFAEKMADPETFNSLLDQMKALEVIEPEDEKEAEEAEETEDVYADEA